MAGVSETPNEEQRRRVIDELSASYPKTKFNGSPDRETLVSKIEWVISNSSIPRQSSPGYPYAYEFATTEDALYGAYGVIVNDALSILEAWRDANNLEIRKLTPVQLFQRGLVRMGRIFIKQEPHSEKKMREGRYRIIVSVNLALQIAERVLYYDQNQAEIANWDLIGAKPGLSTTDEGNAKLYYQVDEFRRRTGRKVDSDDVYCWDFSVPGWGFDLATEVNLNLMSARGTPWENLIRNADYCNTMLPYMLSDGRIYQQMRPGIMRSGRFTTASINSKVREALAILTKRDDSPNFNISMGDDHVGDQAPRDYERFGFKITDEEISSVGEPFSFCSHYYMGGAIAVPQQWGRTLYRLLSREFDEVEYMQWRYEMRHLNGSWDGVSIADLELIREWCGWIKPQGRAPQNDVDKTD